MEQNGLGLDPTVAAANARMFAEVVQLLEETEETTRHLLALIEASQLKGRRIHDANLVATMRTHGLVCLKTWNPGDFSRLPEVQLV